MAYTLNFSAVQTTALTNILITDLSSGGTDPNLTSRRIYLYKIDGTTLVPDGTTTDYIDFPIVASSGIGDTISVNVLSKDYSLSIYIVCTSSSPIGGAVYSKTAVNTFTGYTNKAAYSLVQDISANPNILNDNGYYSNLGKLYTELDNANQAQAYSDAFSAQSALDRAYQLISHPSLYF